MLPPNYDPDSVQTEYTFDALNRLETLTLEASTAEAQTVIYDYLPNGLKKRVDNPNGTTSTYNYDAASRMTAITHTGPTGVVSAYDYTYGPNGNRIQQIEQNAGRTETTLYDYDLVNRLIMVTYEAATATANQVSYTYDRVGNRRTERTVDLATSTVTKDLTYAYDAINRLETIDDVLGTEDVVYAYDSNGNTLSKTKAGVTTQFLYNIRNQLGEVRQETSVLGRYGYDAEGMRILKISDDGRRQYTYDQLSVITEANESNATVSKYDYGLDQLVSLDNTSEGRSFFHLDFLGSTANLTETVGSTRQSILYDAWGNERDRIGTSANKFTFTGHEKDEETGLIYAKARFYDPDIGRFLTQDDVTGRADSPPSLHRYYYVHQNPLFFVDPTGNVALIQKIRKKMRQFQEDIIDWAVEDEEQKDRHKKDPLGAGMGAGIASSVVGFGEKALGLVNTASNAAIVWFAAYTGYTDSELITDSADELVAGIKDLATVARTVDEHGLYQTIGEVAWDGAKSTGIKIYDASQGDVRAIAELTAGAMEITAEVVVGTKGMAALSRGRAASTVIRETVESGAARSTTTTVRRTAGGTAAADAWAARAGTSTRASGIDVEGFRLGKHGAMPRPRAGMESHHGVMSRWMKERYPTYNPDKAPAVLMPREAHNATRGVYNRWRREVKQRMGGAFDWSRVSEADMRVLGDKMFQASNTPLQIQQRYWDWFDRMRSALEP